MARLFFWFAGAISVAWGNSVRHPNLTDSAARRIQETLARSPGSLNQEAIEKTYQESVQRQTFADAAEIYDPANADSVRVAYAAFTPDLSDEPGEDLGYGFHVVKRLELPLSDGSTKVIEVNEAWPENKRDGGLLAPDEIRIKTQIFTGARHLPGSHRLFAYDSVHLAWGSAGEIEMVRRTRRIGNRATLQRVPVAAPGSCLKCHGPGLSRIYAGSFTRPGETPDFESIVRPSFYDRPLKEMKGYREYLDYLMVSGNHAQLGPAVRDLARPAGATALPMLAAVFREKMGAYHWIGDDGGAAYGQAFSLDRQGHYLAGTQPMVDALEGFFYGKYDWWSPTSRIGGGSAADGY